MAAPATRRTRDAARTTAEILQAGTAEFAAQGFAGARVDRIAEASGTNKALLFHRFGDKAGLYRAVLETIRDDALRTRVSFVDSRLSSPPGTATEFRAIVEDLVRVNLAFLQAHPAALRILSWEQASGWVTFGELPPAADDAGLVLLSAFRAAATHGWLRPGADPATQLAATFDVAHAWLTSRSHTRRPLDAAERTFIARFVADGLVGLEGRES